AVLFVLGIGDGVEEQFEAGDAADVFGWGAAGAADETGILDSGIGVGDRLDRDRVPPVVAEVVGVGQLRDAAIDQRAEPYGLSRVGLVAGAIPFGIGDGVALSVGAELEQVIIVERHGRLDDVVQGLERCRQRHLGAPPDGWLPVIELDPDAGDAIGVAHAANLADCAFQFHGRSSASLLCGVSAMRASTAASQACGSTSLSFAVPIRVYMTAARSAPRSDPAKSHDFLPRARPRSARSA